MTFKEGFELETTPGEGKSALYIHFIKSHETFLGELWNTSRKNTLEDMKKFLNEDRGSTSEDISIMLYGEITSLSNYIDTELENLILRELEKL